MTATAAPVLVMGEALVDLVPAAVGDLPGYVPHPGGAPANLAAGLARLGVPVSFVGGLGRDAFGAANERRLSAAGVDLRLCTHPDRPTALAVAHLPQLTPPGLGRTSPGGTSPVTSPWGHSPSHRSGRSQGILTPPVRPRGTTARGPSAAAGDECGTAYDFHLDGTATFRIAPLTSGLDGFRAVCVGGLAAVVAPAADAVAATAHAASEQSVLVVDPNVRTLPALDPAECRQRLVRLCEQAHIVKASDEDLSRLWPGETAEAACRRLSAAGRLVVLTRGAEGSTAFTPRGHRVAVPPVPVRVVNTIGAGDAFTAGLLTGLARADLLHRTALTGITADQARRVLTLGAQVAASVCAQAGSEPADAAACLT
ncbi:PfkB family carbohydrate kinase [Streptomyces sp. KR80]|uniref:PfkB family carbohydrate kinase n=1 Tax=Streptomyces sp. KR80 TaxID=3457426 RepID=UPI003FCFD6E4